MSSAIKFQTTTVRLPKLLYEHARAAVRESGVAASINDFLVVAVEEKLRQLREQEIDAAFAGMREDKIYRHDAVSLSESFERSDWDAYRSSEAPPKYERSRTKKSAKAAKG